MAKAFSIRDLMDNDLRQQDDIYKRVSVYDVESNPGNEYSLSEIEKMKDSIFALGGVQQNIVIVEFPDGAGADHKYLALDGHRRLLASRELVEEGHNEFEFIPAVIKGKLEAGMDGAVLVMMNSTQRNKTDWEKVMEHMKLKEIIPKLKKRQGVDGRTRDIEADMLGVSRTQVNIYNTIGTRLHDDLMELFRTGGIGISLAYEAAKQEPGIQMQLVELARKTGSVTEEDIKRLSVSRIGNGQQELPEKKSVEEYVSESDTFLKTQAELISAADPAKEYVSESDTSGEAGDGPLPGPEVKENVPESGTSGKTPEEQVHDMEAAPDVRRALCRENDAYEIYDVLDAVFYGAGSFPEEKLDELKDAFRYKPNFDQGSLAAGVLFDKVLPYRNGSVKVSYFGSCASYQVDYIFSYPKRSVIIAIDDFWACFADFFFGGSEKQQVPKKKNVPDSGTFMEASAAVGSLEKREKLGIAFRGGYEPVLIDDLIDKYTSYLEIAVPEKVDNLICEYNCLLDALDLLRKKLNEEGNSNDL